MPKLTAIQSVQSVLVGIEAHTTSQARDPNWQNDDDVLLSLGYKPQMKREFNSLELFGVAFSIMSLVPSIASSFTDSLYAGAVGMTWFWLIPSVFVLSVGISMSELASAQPTSGGLYYWTFFLAPEKLRRPMSFLTGYANTLGLIGGVCSINYSFGTLVMSLATITTDGRFSSTKYEYYALMVAVSCIQLGCLSLPSYLISKFQTVCVALNLLLVFLVIIAVPIGAHNNHVLNSGKFVFGDTTNQTDWQYGWSCLLSMMCCIWTIGAFDSAVHTSEEATNAQTAAPKAIIMSITMCGLLGFGVMAALAAAMPKDFNLIINSWTGQPMAAVLMRALGKKWTLAIVALMVVAQFGMGLSILFAASRQIFAFARDDALPLSRWVKLVTPRTKTPLFAGVFAVVVACAISCLVLINGTAALALFSLAASSNNLAFGLPVFCKLLRTLRGEIDIWKPGPFFLGTKLSTANNIVTVIWSIFTVCVLTMLPTTKHPDKNTMNYTVCVNVPIWLLALLYFYTLKRDFNGPKLEVPIQQGIEVGSDGELDFGAQAKIEKQN
nr:Uga4.2 [Starmerella bombicola]